MSAAGDQNQGRPESPVSMVGVWARVVGAGDMVVSALETREDRMRAEQEVVTEAMEEARENPEAEQAGDTSETEMDRELPGAEVVEEFQESGATGEDGEMPGSGCGSKVEEIEEAKMAREVGDAVEVGEIGGAGVAGEIQEVEGAGQAGEAGGTGETGGADESRNVGATGATEIVEAGELSEIPNIGEAGAMSGSEELGMARQLPIVGKHPTSEVPGGSLHEVGSPQFMEMMPRSWSLASFGGGNSGASGGSIGEGLGLVDDDDDDNDDNDDDGDEEINYAGLLVEANRLPLGGFRFMFLDMVHSLLHRIYYNDHMLVRARGGRVMPGSWPRQHPPRALLPLLRVPRQLLRQEDPEMEEVGQRHVAPELDADMVNDEDQAIVALVEDAMMEPEQEEAAVFPESTNSLTENLNEMVTDVEKEEEKNEDNQGGPEENPDLGESAP